MKISQKLKLKSLVVLALLASTVCTAIIFIRLLMSSLQQLVEVASPLQVATLEMEINSSETSRAVLSYMINHHARYLDKLQDSEGDFEQYFAEFDRLAQTVEQRKIGRRDAPANPGSTRQSGNWRRSALRT